MAKLIANVHVGEIDGVDNDTQGWYGPEYGNAENVPTEVARRIPNPKAWEDGEAPDLPDEDQGTDPGPQVVQNDEPPRSGAGSGKEAWRSHAEGLGIDVPDDASRDDIIALVDRRHAEQD
jgi:hypothetical protein